MYSKVVTEFVESNIDLIDKEDWEQLLRYTMGPFEILTDNEVLELYCLLKEIGINITRDIIDPILLNILKEAFDVYFNNNEQGNVVYFINHYMENTLGLSKAEAINFIHMNEEDLNIMCDENGTVLKRDIN